MITQTQATILAGILIAGLFVLNVILYIVADDNFNKKYPEHKKEMDIENKKRGVGGMLFSILIVGFVGYLLYCYFAGGGNNG